MTEQQGPSVTTGSSSDHPPTTQALLFTFTPISRMALLTSVLSDTLEWNKRVGIGVGLSSATTAAIGFEGRGFPRSRSNFGSSIFSSTGRAGPVMRLYAYHVWMLLAVGHRQVGAPPFAPAASKVFSPIPNGGMGDRIRAQIEQQQQDPGNTEVPPPTAVAATDGTGRTARSAVGPATEEPTTLDVEHVDEVLTAAVSARRQRNIVDPVLDAFETAVTSARCMKQVGEECLTSRSGCPISPGDDLIDFLSTYLDQTWDLWSVKANVEAAVLNSFADDVKLPDDPEYRTSEPPGVDSPHFRLHQTRYGLSDLNDHVDYERISTQAMPFVVAICPHILGIELKAANPQILSHQGGHAESATPQRDSLGLFSDDFFSPSVVSKRQSKRESETATPSPQSSEWKRIDLLTVLIQYFLQIFPPVEDPNGSTSKPCLFEYTKLLQVRTAFDRNQSQQTPALPPSRWGSGANHSHTLENSFFSSSRSGAFHGSPSLDLCSLYMHLSLKLLAFVKADLRYLVRKVKPNANLEASALYMHQNESRPTHRGAARTGSGVAPVVTAQNIFRGVSGRRAVANEQRKRNRDTDNLMFHTGGDRSIGVAGLVAGLGASSSSASLLVDNIESPTHGLKDFMVVAPPKLFAAEGLLGGRKRGLGIRRVPFEVQREVLDYLPPRNLFSAVSTCWAWHSIASQASTLKCRLQATLDVGRIYKKFFEDDWGEKEVVYDRESLRSLKSRGGQSTSTGDPQSDSLTLFEHALLVLKTVARSDPRTFEKVRSFSSSTQEAQHGIKSTPPLKTALAAAPESTQLEAALLALMVRADLRALQQWKNQQDQTGGTL